MVSDQRDRAWGSIRWWGYLFPPAGLLLVWRRRGFSLRRRLAATAGLLAYTVLYAAGVVGVLMLTMGLEIEWRGGFPPVLTFQKTKPDYDAVERHRATQVKLAEKPAEPAASYWNGYRGPRRDGVYDEQPILTDWPASGPPRLWKQPCGSGYASFAIAGSLAFTIEQRREEEAVVAYDVETGAEVWVYCYSAKFDEPLGGEGPRATPAFDNGKVYSLGALGDLFCLDAATGQVLWHKNLLGQHRAELPTYGMSASPLVLGDYLIVCAGGSGGRSVVAYDKNTGEVLWTALDDPVAYSSPMLVDLAGELHLLVATATRVVGLATNDGRLLWEFPWKVNQGNRNIAQPVVLGSNRFFLSAGYGTGCAVVEVRRENSQLRATQIWRNRNLKNKFTSSVFWNGHIYGLDEDILTCLDAGTGERKWKDGRYGYGQLLLASGHLVILSGDGQLALVEATPDEHREKARFQALQGKTWNHLAMSQGKLLARNMVEMGCWDLRKH